MADQHAGSVRDWEGIATHLAERDEAWKRLAQYLVTNRGFAPEYDMTGLWVDLYDEAMSEGTDES